ncbi:Asp23/Gls24 family envelope stress response protein [Sulfobacillus thermosulfidooxidans]|uniref:Asp23/Gls24 family envelope stress response protein n=1 Tax=Sulfobacillus thermosulfidooxidans TaxID=28034 RepID=UPI00096B8C67|nr:Asp23/Gls24 family envelope stress response protein [Sulfobacillus thermosulfidooxidans]OLZ08540.1 alkaline-shock protein [Sulfobacillus thermosulfidooxidans]OLZ13142.1 alkaline-shock protein [Sulfobacillus thermosulfidooxidans]OLZ21522.1 alkaline-shock protein [Sulfobacillus thermosulfidooxidans]
MADTAQEIKTIPSVRIANEVIAVIAGIAASEVDGVAAMSGGLTGGITEMLGKKAASRGVKLEVKDNRVSLDLYVVVQYGAKIPEVASRIQDRVKEQVELMTGLTVSDVNIHVQGVSFASTEDNSSGNPASSES